MNFRTAYTGSVRHFSDPGSRERNDYEIVLDEKGHKKLEFVGTHDIYQEIQSYEEECKIENILARAAAGDMTALNARKGQYADITNMPKNLAEAQNIIIKLGNEFEKLPLETRKKFNNSKEYFISIFGSDEFNEFMGFKTEEAENTKEVEFVPGTKEAAQPLTPEE